MTQTDLRLTDDSETVAVRTSAELRDRLKSALKSQQEQTETANEHEPATETENAELSQDALEVAQSLNENPVSVPVLRGMVLLSDILVILTAAGFATLSHQAEIVINGSFFVTLALALAGVIAFFHAADSYQVPIMSQYIPQIGRVAAGWTLVIALIMLLRMTTNFGIELPKAWVGYWFTKGLLGLVITRYIAHRFIRHYMEEGRLERRAVIVGGGSTAADLIRELESQAGNDIRICGIFDDRSNERSPAVVAGYPKLGNISSLVRFARLARIDMLIVCMPLRAEKRVLELLRRLWVLPVDIRLSAHMDKLHFRNRGTSFIGAVPFVDVVEKPIAEWDMVAKRIFDLFFATLALVLLSPVMVITALVIKLDSKGPVLFRQKRYGFNNEVIDVLKFRSMYHDMSDPAARKVVTRNDPRVTPVGRFIRKSSIDELPQLFNVLSGSLSLVGPRPHAVNAHTDNKAWDDVVDGYFARHKVKPGVTGWAQVNGWRGEVDAREKILKRVECDVYYIENWSILFDLKILFITPFKLMDTRNAY